MKNLVYALLVVVVAACGSKKGDDDKTGKASRATDAAPAVAKAKPIDAAPVPDATPPDPVGEFDAQAQLFYRITACAGDAEIPENIDAKVVDKHCKALDKIVAKYRKRWFEPALPFLRSLVPEGLPDTVIYPFGGEDLVSALAVFPDAKELTIFSLEEAKDPRNIEDIESGALSTSLYESREHLRFLLDVAFHKTTELKRMAKRPLSEQIIGAMFGLAMHDKVPVSLRFFDVNDDGTLEYSTEAFGSFELTFRSPGGPIQTYRHIAGDISDGGLKKSPGVVAYIESRKPFAAMTKAASFLMWYGHFETIRDLMLDNMVWMISDATAPKPSHAEPKGFEHVPYGIFRGPEPAFDYIAGQEEVVQMWRGAVVKKLPMRWGYKDSSGNGHLLITRKTDLANKVEPKAPDKK